jgi:hypothetical protein
MLAVTRPIWTRLVHAATWMRGVAVGHVRVRCVRRMLRAVRVCWTRRRDGRIYRYIVVRLVRVGFITSPVLRGHGRTVWVWLLSHGAVAGATARRRVGTL